MFDSKREGAHEGVGKTLTEHLTANVEVAVSDPPVRHFGCQSLLHEDSTITIQGGEFCAVCVLIPHSLCV